MTKYAKHARAQKETPQTEKAAKGQKKNSAGGFSFALDKWGQLDRFLVLGAEGPTFYASEKKVVKKNLKALGKCLEEDGVRTVNKIVEVSKEGRAPKNDPAIFALASAAAFKVSERGKDAAETRKAALAALPAVCRTGTHLFQFAEDVQAMRGWGRSLREAVAGWYTNRPADKLAYQVVKYQSRNGWSHRDLLRKAHVGSGEVSITDVQQAVFRWVASDSMGERHVARRDGKDATYASVDVSLLPPSIQGWEAMKRAKTAKEAVKLITEFNLTHEMVLNDFKKDPTVWEALLVNMPITALIRNLGRMSAIGLLKPMSSASKVVCMKLTDATALKYGRVHPLAILVALNTYKNGRGVRGNLTWTVNQDIADALDSAFYMAFKAIEPSGKNHLLALDVSGSMGWGEIAGMPGISPRVGSAAMAMATARTEPNTHMFGFCSRFRELKISKRMRLDSVLQSISGLPFGGTDCSLPMQYALQNKIEVEHFVVYTDNETYAGRMHPHQALEAYRQKMGIPAKLTVVGMVANKFTIANPNDAGMLDVVGFDTSAPAVMADFARKGFG
jgi:60 kDa SS-A/Ro ribonucleoprotein